MEARKLIGRGVTETKNGRNGNLHVRMKKKKMGARDNKKSEGMKRIASRDEAKRKTHG